jgi:hypothetical protein
VPAALRAAVGVAACVLTAASPAAASSARSAPAVAGAPGYCHTAAGVTVVVDMSALGGGVTVRCAPGGGQGYSGLDALHGAGFTVTGTQRFGSAFVCRIQGRPSATEALAIPGNARYHEECVDTPPATAFWSYWSAHNGGSWTYNASGASSHDTIAGGFEGWAFSLGHAGSPTAPALRPVRPQAPPPSAPPTPTSAPTSPPPHHHKPPGGGPPPATTTPPPTTSTHAPTPTFAAPTSDPSPATTDSSRVAPGHSAATTQPSTPRKHARPHHHAPVTQAAPTTGTATGVVRVSGDLPRSPGQSAGSSRPALVGAVLVVLLGLGAGLTAWRRSRRG